MLSRFLAKFLISASSGLKSSEISVIIEEMEGDGDGFLDEAMP